MSHVERCIEACKRFAIFVRAGFAALALGLIETFGSARGRRVLAVVALAGGVTALGFQHPIRTIRPGEIGVRINTLTGGVTPLPDGWALVLPLVHDLRRYPLRDQIYRPAKSASAKGDSPFQSVEGLSVGMDVGVRYALDPARAATFARALPENLDAGVIEPVIDGVLHRVVARHTVREIFTSQRAEIQKEIEDQLRQLLAGDGIVVRAAFVGNVDLPAQYKAGLEALLSEELSSEKMRFTLELKEKRVKEAALDADADKARREKAAEAAGLEEIIAAKSREEAMKHVLPYKQKEIEQRRLEAEATKVQQIKNAEGQAEARKIEAEAEAVSRRKLAEAEAFRIDVTGKAQSEQMARDSEMIAKNPLLIQKTLADKLSDKIQVVVAPPSAGGFFAGGLLGTPAEHRLAAKAGTAGGRAPLAAAAPAGDDAEGE